MALVANQERVWLGREVLRAAQKSLKARKLYGLDHAQSRSSRDELAGLLRTFLKLHGALRATVTRSTLLLGTDSIYEEEDRRENLAFRLFLGGVREIKIEGELPDTDVDGLLTVFEGALEDRDAASISWDLDFSSIELVCLNELAEGWDEPEDLSPGAAARIREMNAHADVVVEGLKKRKIVGDGGLVYTATDSAAELERLDRIQLAPERGDDAELPPFAVVTREQLDDLRQEAAALGSPEVVLALVDEVRLAIEKDPETLGATDGVWFLEEAPAAALRRHNLELLATILERYVEVHAESRGELRATLERVYASFPTPERVERLVKATMSGGLGGPSALCRVFRTLGELGTFAAVAAYLEAKTREVRDALLEFLGEVGPDHPDALGRLLHPSVDADTAKWALFLVNKRLKGQAAERLYLAGTAHPAPAVARYADFLYRTQTEKGRLIAFQESLDAPDEKLRLRALESIVKSRDFGAFEAVKAAIDAAQFLTRSSDERRVFLEAVGTMGGRGALGFMARQADRRSVNVLRYRAVQEIRAVAAELMVKLSAPDAEPSWFNKSSDRLGKSSDRLGKSSDKLGKSSDKLGKSSDRLGKSSDKLGKSSDKLGKSSANLLARSSDKLSDSSARLAPPLEETKEEGYKLPPRDLSKVPTVTSDPPRPAPEPVLGPAPWWLKGQPAEAKADEPSVPTPAKTVPWWEKTA